MHAKPLTASPVALASASTRASATQAEAASDQHLLVYMSGQVKTGLHRHGVQTWCKSGKWSYSGHVDERKHGRGWARQMAVARD